VPDSVTQTKMKSDGARGKLGAGGSDSLMAAWLAEDTETLKGGT
jgi:hypothetical protein